MNVWCLSETLKQKQKLKRRSQTLTDRFPWIKLGVAVSGYVSLIFGSQCLQLMFDDVLTLSHAQEAVSVPWR